MDNQNNTLTRLVDIINKSSSGAIVLSSNPTPDAVAAACSLYLGLTKMGKSVALLCSNSQNLDLVGTDKIQNQFAISGDNLVVSFPYTDGAVDKVDYNIQGNSFNLVISPRPGFAKLNPNEVKYSYSGGVVDFIVTIDSPTLNNLGMIYSDNQNQFQGKEIINIDRHLTNSYYGTVNFVQKTSSSVSELVLKVFQSLRLEIDKDMATNLYAGISASTNNFSSYSVSAATFENIAALLRAGAAKKTLKKSGLPQQPSFQPSSAIMDDAGFIQPAQFNNMPQVTQNSNLPKVKTQNREKQTVKAIESVEKESQPEQQTPPQDWLKPKIFRGGGMV